MEHSGDDCLPLKIKWKGAIYEFTLPKDAVLGDLKAKLFTLTRVSPERQKLMGVKLGGKIAKHASAPLRECTYKSPIMMIGSPEESAQVDTPVEERPQVLDDFQLYTSDEIPGYAFGGIEMIGPDSIVVPLGEPALVQVTSPAIRHPEDWIGLYRVSSGNDAVAKAELIIGLESCVVMLVPPTAGVYEFRYHFGLNASLVMSKSLPFDVAPPYPADLLCYNERRSFTVLTWNVEHVSFDKSSTSFTSTSGSDSDDSDDAPNVASLNTSLETTETGDTSVGVLLDAEGSWSMGVTEPYDFDRVRSAEQYARAKGLLDELKRQDADVVFLQEFSAHLLPFVLACSWIQERYICCDLTTWIEHEDVRDALGGQYVLSKLPLKDVYFKELSSCQDRGALVAVLKGSNGQNVGLASVWLDSHIEDQECRFKQMDETVAELARYDHAVWVGDFNFDEHEDEYKADQAHIERHEAWRDVWPHLHGGERGITWDVDGNIKARKGCFFRPPRNLRLDRIMWRQGGATNISSISPSSIDIIGTEPVHPSHHPQVYPSDHYGLVASFAVCAEEGGNACTSDANTSNTMG